MSGCVCSVLVCVCCDDSHLVSVVLFIQPVVSSVFTVTEDTDLKH